MWRAWISRIGFTLAVIGFAASLAVHLATFAGWGAAQAVPILILQIVALFTVIIIMVVVLVSAALTPGPRGQQITTAPTSWQVRVRTRLALLPRWFFLLMLVVIGLSLYGLGWGVWTLLTPLNEVPANNALPILRSFSAEWAGMYLIWALLIGEFGLGWLRREAARVSAG